MQISGHIFLFFFNFAVVSYIYIPMNKLIFSFLIAVIQLFVFTPTLSGQIFYKISGNGLEKPSYLLGSHHLAPLSVLDSISSIQDALENVGQIVGEIDMTGDPIKNASVMQSYMMAPADSTLSAVLSKEDYDKVASKFMETVGIPLQSFDVLRPMVPITVYTIGIMSTTMPDFNPSEQIDTYFQNEGKQRGLKITPLEDIAEQAEILYCSLTIAEQAKELVDNIENTDDLIESSIELNENYLKGDLDGLYLSCLKENSHPEYFEKLTKERNLKWMQKLPSIMNEMPAFIVVGAAHLCGENGLINELKKEGFTVEPM